MLRPAFPIGALVTASLIGCAVASGPLTPPPPARAQEVPDDDALTDADREILAAADALEEQIGRLRGRPFKASVPKQVYSREQLAEFLAKNFSDEDTLEELRREETFLRAIGFLPAEVNLGEMYGQMLGSQIAGFYDPEDRTLRCISSDIALVQRMTMVHEIYHGLQDQYDPLTPYMEAGIDAAHRRTDPMRARQAVVEGDAQHFTTLFMAANPVDVLEDLKSQSPRELFSFGLEQAIATASIPPYFADLLTWPYLAGAGFIAALRERGGWEAVDRAFVTPPLSSEQILHPVKYLDGGDPPLVVSAPTPAFAAGRAESMRDTLGEAQLAALLNHMGQDLVHAKRGSEGWGGDEVLVLRDDAGADLLIWKLAWDSPRDAEQFFAAWRHVLKKVHGAEAIAALPARFADAKLPEGASLCIAEPSEPEGAAPTWLLRNGTVTLILRGAELAKRTAAELAALASMP